MATDDPVRVVDRITWGANPSTVRDVMNQGLDGYLRAQLRGTQGPDLPEAIQSQIAQLTIERTPERSDQRSEEFSVSV